MKIVFTTIILLITIYTNISMSEPAQNGDYVVVLHGIIRSSSHMQPLAEQLQEQGYDVINIDYPSTKYPLEQLIDIINKDLSEKITADKPVHFVGYSMGGILALALINKHRPNKLGRVVQLAPPNHGSEVADFLKNNWLYKTFYGPAGGQLTTNNKATEKLLGKIDFELGVIAGNSSIDPISSYLIGGDDDGKVSIESTKIAGMKDHVVVAASHAFFPSNKDVQKQTLYFLQNGKFNKAQKE